jgi:hypothetical protein
MFLEAPPGLPEGHVELATGITQVLPLEAQFNTVVTVPILATGTLPGV